MNIIQRLRKYFTVKAAEKNYEKMAQHCNELYKQTKQHHYIVIDQLYGGRITLTNRANFRAIKQAINDQAARMKNYQKETYKTDSTMIEVHDGCFYSSLLQKELDDLMQKPLENSKAIRKKQNDIEARRLAYIKWVLENAKTRTRKNGKLTREQNRVVAKEIKAYKKMRKNKK